MYPVEFSYLRAESVAHALAVLAGAVDSGGVGDEADDDWADDDVKVLAGGQSLLPMMKLRLAMPGVLLDIGGLAELRDVRLAEGRIGTAVTYRALRRDPLLAPWFPTLADALRVLADPQVRARGTIGGAVAHGDPAADLPAVLLALDASLVLARQDGSRTVTLDDFLRGAFETDLGDDELVSDIVLPATPGIPAGQAYEKFEQPASHLPLAGVCAVLDLADGAISGARITVTGVAGWVFRAPAAEAALTGQPPADAVLDSVAGLVRDGVARPLADIHASGSFRLHLAEVLTRRALRRAVDRAVAGAEGLVGGAAGDGAQ
jgi:carbon-monoxide dehydrogenase medium subunit